MRKFINIVKKPLLYGAVGVFVVFTALLVIISSLKHGKTYTYEMSVAGISMEATYTFEDKDTITVEAYVLGELSKSEIEYDIKDGKLFSKQETLVEGEYEWVEMGKINAYEIVMETVDEDTGLDMELVLECKANKTVRTLSIVMMCVSGVLAIAAVVVRVLDQKGIIKLKSDVKPQETIDAQPTETAETAEVQTVETQVETETKE